VATISRFFVSSNAKPKDISKELKTLGVPEQRGSRYVDFGFVLDGETYIGVFVDGRVALWNNSSGDVYAIVDGKKYGKGLDDEVYKVIGEIMKAEGNDDNQYAGQ